MMVYKAAIGSTLTDGQAQQYGESIAAIIENSGGVTKQDVVDKARDLSSGLHDFFEWDDMLAAEQFRVTQASYLLRSIYVVVKENGEGEPIRAFHSVFVKIENTEEHERVYVQITDVLADGDLLRQVIQQALKQLQSWQKRYAQYKDAELEPVFLAIEQAMEKIAA